METSSSRAPVVVVEAANDGTRGPMPAVPPHEALGPLVERQLAACRRYGAGLAVLSIALDGLQAIGKRHGRDAEERLVEAAWQRLKSRLRAADMVARMGPDTFGAVLFNVSDPATAQAVEARLFDELSSPYRVGNLVVEVMAVTGAAVFPRAGITADELVASAVAARLCKAE
jgi:diguanylate cyclase (GGDEF)-like protein